MDALDNIELDTSIRVVRIEFFRSVQRKDCYGTTIFAQEDGRCLPFECVHVSSLKARLMLPQNASRWGRGQLPTIPISPRWVNRVVSSARGRVRSTLSNGYHG